MTIRNEEVSTSRSAPQSTALKQSGRRVVRHKAGRLAGSGETNLCLIAMPTLPGESLEKMTIQAYACADANVQPDSPIHVDWISVWYPWDFLSSITGASLDTAGLNSMISKASDAYVDPNPSGEDPTEVDTAFGAMEVLWTRETLLYAKLFAGISDILGSDARPADRFTETLKRKLYWEAPGILLIGIKKMHVAAQTDFGVAEIDTGLTGPGWSQILSRDMGDEFAELSAQEAKAFELVYGGDTYIEADTWKEDAVRVYALAQAVFRTPYPEPGKGFRES